MKSRLFLSIVLAAALLAFPAAASAQEATIIGTVTDSTGGVLPGVTVTATHTATGNTFFFVTDDRGAFRIPARIGAYTITAELAGFSPANRSGLTVQVGQTVDVNLQLAPS